MPVRYNGKKQTPQVLTQPIEHSVRPHLHAPNQINMSKTSPLGRRSLFEHDTGIKFPLIHFSTLVVDSRPANCY